MFEGPKGRRAGRLSFHCSPTFAPNLLNQSVEMEDYALHGRTILLMLSDAVSLLQVSSKSLLFYLTVPRQVTGFERC